MLRRGSSRSSSKWRNVGSEFNLKVVVISNDQTRPKLQRQRKRVRTYMQYVVGENIPRMTFESGTGEREEGEMKSATFSHEL